VAGEGRWQDHIGAADAGIEFDRKADPEREDDGGRVRDDGVDGLGPERVAGEEQAADQPGKDGAEDDGAGQLGAPVGEDRAGPAGEGPAPRRRGIGSKLPQFLLQRDSPGGKTLKRIPREPSITPYNVRRPFSPRGAAPSPGRCD
jgi:hypothetical protein